MPYTNLHRFQQHLLRSPDLRAELSNLAAGGPFVKAVVAAGVAHSEFFTGADVERELRASSRSPIAWTDNLAELPAGRWVPHRLVWREGRPWLAWCDLGDAEFTEPFFEQTIARCMSRPLNRLLTFETPLDKAPVADAEPDGLIFHMSRCGSTLVAQMLAALPGTMVLSEPEVIDGILGAQWRAPAVDKAQCIAWLRAVVGAFRRPTVGAERLFIKLESWHVRALPLLAEAFPNTPWIFVHRDPLEVMVSHDRQRGRQMVPGQLDDRWLDLPRSGISSGDLDAHAARVLARLCEAAVAHQSAGRGGRLIDYASLPEAGWTEVADAFGLSLEDADIARMKDVAQFHAKHPTEPFEPDSADKTQSASPHLRNLAQGLAGPHYTRLLAIAAAQLAQAPQGSHD